MSDTESACRKLVELLESGNAASLRQVLPWITHLPDKDIDTLLAELMDAVREAATSDDLAPIALLLTQWKHSAEVCADPVLYAILTREPNGDLGPVSVPEKDE